MSGATNDTELPIASDRSGHNVLVGENDQLVSIQLIQQIFNEITGKTENLADSFDKPYQIEFCHIEDLHHRLNQTLEQYNTVSKNCAIVIYYADNSKDELKSFDRFAFHHTSSSIPVESVFLKYDFLIIPQQIKKAQSYTVSLRLASSVAIRKRIEASKPFGPSPIILRLMRNRIAYSTVEYIDYTVARAMQTVIRDWFSTLPKDSKKPVLNFLQSRSHFIPRTLRFLTVIASSTFCLRGLLEYQSSELADAQYVPEVVLSIFILVYASYVISSWIGEYAEAKLDEWSPISYLKFNKADEIEIQKYRNGNRSSLLRCLSGFALALATSLLTKTLSGLILAYLTGKQS